MMGGAHTTHGNLTCVKILVENPEGKRELGRPKSRLGVIIILFLRSRV
jgi:hypothetical protein